MPDAAAARVAVIGGGWAGCAAAVTLAAAGVPVTLFEQARTLGGRARRVERDGIALDNGQHLVIGAYRQTLALLATVHRAGGCRGAVPSLAADAAPLRRAPARRARIRGLERAGAAASRRRRARRAGIDLARAPRADRRFPPSHARGVPRRPGRVGGAVPGPDVAPRLRRRLGAALPRRAQHAAGARVGPDVRARAARRVHRHASQQRFPRPGRSICRRAFPMPRRSSSLQARRRRAQRRRRARDRAHRRRRRAAHGRGRGELFAAAIVAVGPHQLATTVGAAAAKRRRVARAARADRRVRLRIDHDDLLRIRRTGRLRRADAPARRCARPLGVRPQRSARQRRGRRHAKPDRRGHQRRRTARCARPRDARAQRRGAAAPARPRIFRRSPSRA